jgi:hypothetical protein
MTRRRNEAAAARARWLELTDAVAKELAGGRPRAAIVLDLMALGIDKIPAQRLVERVAASTGPPRRRGRWPGGGQDWRLATSALLVAAGLLVAFACVSARQLGFAFWIALVAVAAGLADGSAAVRTRRRRAA